MNTTKIIALLAGVAAVLVIGAPAARACEEDCYNSGNTGIHCVPTNCDDSLPPNYSPPDNGYGAPPQGDYN
jgi:hypothetical protein